MTNILIIFAVIIGFMTAGLFFYFAVTALTTIAGLIT